MIKALSINEMDNVIVAIEPITRGEIIKYKDKKNNIKKMEVLEDITIYHKIATADIKQNEVVIKYGEHIGKAVVDIRKGTHVHIHNTVSEKN
ncbi:UxaA family hydrolase [Fusobacterium sp. THCT1E2]